MLDYTKTWILKSSIAKYSNKIGYYNRKSVCQRPIEFYYFQN